MWRDEDKWALELATKMFENAPIGKRRKFQRYLEDAYAIVFQKKATG